MSYLCTILIPHHCHFLTCPRKWQSYLTTQCVVHERSFSIRHLVKMTILTLELRMRHKLSVILPNRTPKSLLYYGPRLPVGSPSTPIIRPSPWTSLKSSHHSYVHPHLSVTRPSPPTLPCSAFTNSGTPASLAITPHKDPRDRQWFRSSLADLCVCVSSDALNPIVSSLFNSF